jgi:hypothetical protein
LQLPIAGHPLHTRSLSLVVSQRADGRWGARGDVIDLRKVGFVPMVSDIQPAGIIHQMSIALDIDRSTRVIERIEVEQPVVAIEPSRVTGGECCRDPASRLLELEGERIDAELAKRLSGVFGGPRGCSHLLTLFQAMSAGIGRAFELEDVLEEQQGALRAVGERLFQRAVFVDGYEAANRSIELALQQSDFHTWPAALVRQPLERLAGEWDVRAFARVADAKMTLRDLKLAERFRDAASVGSATWSDRSERLRGLEGSPILPGLARRLFELLGSTPQDALLLNAMLQLAPAHIQVLAAVMDRWYVDRDEAAEKSPGPSEAPEVGNIGGLPDSCYMWRRDGPLAGMRPAEPSDRRRVD